MDVFDFGLFSASKGSSAGLFTRISSEFSSTFLFTDIPYLEWPS